MEKYTSGDNGNGQAEELYQRYTDLLRIFRSTRNTYGYNSFYTREAQREMLEAWDQYSRLAYPEGPEPKSKDG